MAEFEGIVYDEAACEMFQICLNYVIGGITALRASQGDAFAEEYMGQVVDLIHSRAGAPDSAPAFDPPVTDGHTHRSTPLPMMAVPRARRDGH